MTLFSSRTAAPVQSLVIAAVLLLGCGVSLTVYEEIERNAFSGNYSGAVTALERNREEYGTTSDVLFNLEMGLLRHYQKECDRSNRHFLDAERRMEQLFTKSVSTEAAALLTNDNLLPYEGEDFEKVFVNLFLALNFAQMGNFEAALVEARKVDVKLGQLSRLYEDKNTYKHDAFVRYIVGALYEADGEMNDAFIAYRNALEAYRSYQHLYGVPVFAFLKDDLLRTADQLGFIDEKERYERQFGKTYIRSGQSEGSLCVIIHSGKGPVKEEFSIQASVADSGGIVHTFKVALPTFKARERATRSYVVELTDRSFRKSVKAEVGQDVTRIAGKALDERIKLLYLKAGGRAVLKFLAAEKVKKEFRKNKEDESAVRLFSSLVDLAYTASERADVRTWRTLPDKIHIARVQLPAGEYGLSLTRADGKTIENEQVKIEHRKVHFKVYSDVN